MQLHRHSTAVIELSIFLSIPVSPLLLCVTNGATVLPATHSFQTGCYLFIPFSKHFLFTITFINMKFLILSFTALQDAPLTSFFLLSAFTIPILLCLFILTIQVTALNLKGETPPAQQGLPPMTHSASGPQHQEKPLDLEIAFGSHSSSAGHMCRQKKKKMFYVATNILGTTNHP